LLGLRCIGLQSEGGNMSIVRAGAKRLRKKLSSHSWLSFDDKGSKTRTGKSATKSRFELAFSAACKAALIPRLMRLG
jgi:hypothetical protein